MRKTVSITVNIMIVAAMVITSFAMMAPAAHAQDGVFLPMVAGNGDIPLSDIDMSLVGTPTEVRSEIPLSKAQNEFGAVTTYDDILVPPSTPLSVRLLSSGVPVVNQAITVKLEVYAYEATADTKAEIALPDGVELLDGKVKAQFDLAAGQKRSLKANVVFRSTGEYELTGTAKSVVSTDPEIISADMDQLFFTIGNEISMAAAASGDNSQLNADTGDANDEQRAAVDAQGEEAEHEAASAETAGAEDLAAALAADEAATIGNPDELKEDTSSAGEDPIVDETDLVEAGATRTISFCWRQRHRDGKNYPMYDAYYRIYDQDGGVGGSDDDLKGTGYLSYYNGCASKAISDSDGAGTADVYVVVYLTHGGRQRVTTNGGTTWWSRSGTKWNITSNTNLGTFYTGTYGSSGNGRSLWLYRDLYWGRRTINQFRYGLGSDSGFVKVRWQSGSTTGTYYSRTNKHIRLKDADVKSPDTVIHEAAHAYMDNLYSGWPISDCTSPHYLNRKSGKGCALSEGWTYVITTLVNGDGSYTWPSGSSLNLETPHCTSSNWDDGPTVEGRVGGTLIDLADPFIGVSVPQGGSYTGLSNETTGCWDDGATGMFDTIWYTLSVQDDQVFTAQGGVTNSFSNAWEARAFPRYFPHRVGHHNTVSTFMHD